MHSEQTAEAAKTGRYAGSKKKTARSLRLDRTGYRGLRHEEDMFSPCRETASVGTNRMLRDWLWYLVSTSANR